MNMHEGGQIINPKRREQIVLEGRRVIYPELAKKILNYCHFEGQTQRMNDLASVHIKRHVDHMSRGIWRTSIIFFALLPDGVMYLVDGYHRLSALIQFGRAMQFFVIVEPCATYEDVRRLYSTFNRPGSERLRTTPQILNALGLADKIGVEKKTLNAAYGVMPVIGNGMRPITRADKDAMAKFGVLEERCELLDDYASEITDFNTCLRGASTPTKVLLQKSPVITVALQTLRYQRQRAMEFWTSVANDDGLRKGTPERTLLDGLRRKSFHGQNDEGLVIVALAWNAFYTRRPIIALKPNQTKHLYIEGTPIDRER